MKLEIDLSNDTEKERGVKKVLEEVIKKYNPPAFTHKVLIEEGSVPHALNNTVTLNTRDIEERSYLKLFVHEQLHLFAQNHSKYNECIRFLKDNYEDNGECNKSGNYPNSFWEHIIVNFNTRNILNKLLSKEDVNYVYSKWQAYPKTEKLVVDNFKKIEKELGQFNMICDT